jgi:LysR substrate binding domain-containing protein
MGCLSHPVHRIDGCGRHHPDQDFPFFGRRLGGVLIGQRFRATERYLSMNEYAGLAAALLAGTGIGDLPPIVQPVLLREGRLVEVMPEWRFSRFDLSLTHPANRYVPPPVRVVTEFVVRTAPTLFPTLPTGGEMIRVALSDRCPAAGEFRHDETRERTRRTNDAEIGGSARHACGHRVRSFQGSNSSVRNWGARAAALAHRSACSASLIFRGGAVRVGTGSPVPTST